MPCGSTTYIPANHIETASPSRQDRLLADIGISREQAVEEVLKSSWAHLLMWHVYR